MTKPYETYQKLEGEPLTERDKSEEGSNFWNEGKWNNYVKPFLNEDPKESTLVDMGCNRGLFLKLAEDMGFKAIGVDSNDGAVSSGLAWRDKKGGKYDIIKSEMKDCDLPLADYTLFVNSHYYYTINDWIDYLDKLQYKTRYCIIVTAEKNHINRCWASADVSNIFDYFSEGWKEYGFIDELPLTGGNPRRLWGLCFKSRFLKKSPIERLDSSNHVQDEFYTQLDEGLDYHKTKYYWVMKKYRKKWSEKRLDNWFQERVDLYESIKKNGQKVPILIDKSDLILDGNHRYAMMRTLGYKKVFTRKV